METFKICRWDTGDLIAEAQGETLKECLEKLVSERKDLYRASLVGARLDRASLVGASLVGASLVGARLVGARLDRASLVGARLIGASLDRASLVGASLDRASLVGASLIGASLDRASLDRASLDGASLVGARLDRARLDFIKHDLWGLLLHAKSEVDGLALALKEGRIDGSCYEGKCACLVGTLANVRHCNYRAIPGITPDSSRPAEVWFMGIQRGDTAESNQIVKITLSWIDEFKTLVQQ